MPVTVGPCGTQTDFNLHGLVGVRLVNADAADVAVVKRQLGGIEAPVNGEPDIVIRFVDTLGTPCRVRYVGVEDAGFTDDAFLVLRGKHKVSARVQIPFERIGQPCEIVCERRVPAVPLLLSIVNLTALAKGTLPLHGSAFTYDGTGVLVTGWAKGGKTETLLSFMANGAEYVGDEWVYLTRDGHRMYGVPEPIRVWDWHLRNLPQYRTHVSRADRMRLALLRMMVRSIDRATADGNGRHRFTSSGMHRLASLLKRQQFVHLVPRETFGDGVGSLAGSPDKIFFVASHDVPEVTVQPIDPQEIARRMVFSLQEERAELISYYLKFRFAFPGLSNDLIEGVEQLERTALSQALAGKEAYAVYHPYPVWIPALFDAIRPLL